MYIYGYKVHVLLDSESALPLAVTITAAGYGENLTVPWFVSMLLALGARVRKFFADMGYDSYGTRFLIIGKLKAVPFIPFNPRSCEGSTKEEKAVRCKTLRHKWYLKNLLRRWWVDPDSKRFDKEYDTRTFSEQVFSVGKGSLVLDFLMHRGREWAMLAVANTAMEVGRPDLGRCVKCFNG